MRGTPSLLLAAMLSLAVTSRAPAQVSADSAKHMAIRHLLAVQHTDSQMYHGLTSAMDQATPDPSLPAGFMDSIRVRAQRNVGQFVERLVPVYDSLFTASDIDQLTQFFDSPIGRRYVSQQVPLYQALAEVGRQWGMELAAQVMLDFSRRRP